MENEILKLDSLPQFAEVLENNAYECKLDDQSVQVKVGSKENPIVGVITIDDSNNSLNITCRIARLGDIPEDNVPQFMAACLDANTRILPYAFGLLTASDNPALDDPREWPIVLVDSMPLGDLSEEEFLSAMSNLWIALQASRDVLSNALTVEN
ncbi:hypothetical protein K8I28_07025 [bacterium]|nr:hypothetical protein [bacterium]